EDFLEHLFVATNHNYLLIFTQKGRCYWMRVFDIPEGTRQSKGRAIQNLVQLDGEDKVVAYLNVTDLKSEDYLDNHFVVLCTKKGVIKKTTLEAYSRPRSNGIIAVKIREEDELLEARLTNGKNDIIMASKEGKAVHFNEAGIRAMGRNSSGVRGMRLASEADEIVGMITVDPDSSADRQVLVVSEKGYGKRSPVNDYRITKRGGKGVKTLQVTDKTGKLIAIKEVKDDDQLMIINRSGLTIRMGLAEMRVLGRATQGVRLIELRKNDKIAAVAKVDSDLKEEVVPEVATTGEEGPESAGQSGEATNGTDVADGGNEE
ncbi:MAG: DNA gyrase subunit A, partial [Flavobacteriales bacterium]|nr:DNA gyrase subunit A [Flavobacteriales bacterium]